MARSVLLTGFDPFGGEIINPALEAVSQLDGRIVGESDRAVISTQRIPTVFGKAILALQAAIDREQPDVVICVGQAGGRTHITPERVAINIDDASIPDNEDNQPIDTAIEEDGPAAYFSKLPIKRIVQSIREAGIPAMVSNSAGTYVCNHLFYGLMHLLETKYPNVRGGFIHIPYIPEQVVNRPSPSMALNDIVKALEIAASVAVTAQSDLVVTGGRDC